MKNYSVSGNEITFLEAVHNTKGLDEDGNTDHVVITVANYS
jgi:hypothetical protein